MKKIGVVGWNVGDNSFGITKPYYEFANLFGSVYILSPTRTEIEPLDLLILPGGTDINPVRYNQPPWTWTSNPDVMKEWFDVVMLPKYIDAKIPIYGICRGMQAIAVHFGGTLLQHIDHVYSEKNRYERVHKICQWVNNVKTTRARSVNSLHHQAVDMDNLPQCLSILATSSEKSQPEYLEMICHKELPIIGVQFHPEELFDDADIDMINKLLLNEQA